MSTALLPRLTTLDRRVLESLPAADEPGKRLADVLAQARGFERGEWLEILRGLEHIGLVTCRGGWWRRA